MRVVLTGYLDKRTDYLVDSLAMSRAEEDHPSAAGAALDRTDLCRNDYCRSLRDRQVDNHLLAHARIWLAVGNLDHSKVLVRKLTGVCAHRQLMMMAMSSRETHWMTEQLGPEHLHSTVYLRGLAAQLGQLG